MKPTITTTSTHRGFARVLLTLALVTATVLATAHLTYRATMRQIEIEIDPATSTAYLTAWNQTDAYSYEAESEVSNHD